MTARHPQIQEAMIAATLADMHSERALATAIEQGEPLSLPQVRSLYAIDTPIYDRFGGKAHYDDSERDPVEEQRKGRFWQYRRDAYDASLEVLQGEYEVDAHWLILNADEFDERLADILAQPGSIRDVTLFASHLTARQQMDHYGALVERSVPVDLKTWFDRSHDEYIAYTIAFHDFVALHAEELIAAGVTPSDVVGYLSRPITIDDIEKLRRWGLADDSIIDLFRSELVEEQFDSLLKQGFSLGRLAARLSVGFRLTVLDSLTTEEGDYAPNEYDFSGSDVETKVRAITAYRQSGREYTKILDLLVGSLPYYTGIRYYDELLESGLPVAELFELYKNNEARKEHLATLVEWFHKNGIPSDDLKKEFSSYELLKVFSWFTKAGIKIDSQEYVDDLTAEQLVEMKRRLWSSESPILLTPDEILDRFKNGKDIALNLIPLIEIGVSPQLLFERMDKTCINERVFLFFHGRGIPPEELWEHTSEAQRKVVASYHALSLLDPESSLLPDEAFEYVGKSAIEKHRFSFLSDERYRQATFARLTPREADYAARKLIDQGTVSIEIFQALEKRDENKAFLPQMLQAGLSLNDIHDVYGIAFGEDEVELLTEAGHSKETIIPFLSNRMLDESFFELSDQLEDKTPLIEALLSKFHSGQFKQKLQYVIELGIPLKDITARMSSSDIVERGAQLLKYGLSYEELAVAIRSAHPDKTEEARSEMLKSLFAESLGR